MDLYGGGASISQANAHTQLARDLNRQTYEFNKSLAEQLDNAIVQQDEDLKGTVQNDIISAGTAGGKLAQLGVAKVAAGPAGKKALAVTGFLKESGGKATRTALGTLELPTTAAERLAKETAARESGEAITSAEDLARLVPRGAAGAVDESLEGAARIAGSADEVAPVGAFVRGAGEVLGRTPAEVAGRGLVGVAAPTQGILKPGEVFTAEAEGRQGLSKVGRGVSREVTTQVERQATEKAAQRSAMSAGERAAAEAADRGAEAAEVAKTALEGGSAAARKELEEKTAAKIGAKIGLTTVGKAAIAGAGGALDVYDDIQRFSTGGLNADTFGSNNFQRVGNIGNIIGSSLEVAGAFGLAVPGVGWLAGGALEALGAGISIASALTEGYGDVKAAEDKKEDVTQDVTSQRRGEVVAQEQETVTARSE
jgi:hypothetical protein